MTASVAYIVFSAILALDPGLAWSIISAITMAGLRSLQWAAWLTASAVCGTVGAWRFLTTRAEVDAVVKDALEDALREKGWGWCTEGIHDAHHHILYRWTALEQGEWAECALTTQGDVVGSPRKLLKAE